MELYEIKNGLEKARSLLAELFISIDIEGLKREIEGLQFKQWMNIFGMIKNMLKRFMIS